ncbi:MAG: pimeloyl-ACP methyl ester esterase BioH [Gammaproteobacteria bacterium]|nr:pimeloyl-ACP methyl ester esterase BioH [Gammaproteobacteria bacterium]
MVKPETVNCVFVHGWAMNSAVWHECIKQLPDWINVVLVDLPGHGSMAEVSASSLDDYVQSLVPLVHRPALWVGWSLGGLVVLRLAELHPQRVAAAMLVATNPCFVTQENWPCAVEREIFEIFSRNLNVQQEKTLRRFLALQVNGLPDAMAVVRQLQKSIQSRGLASAEALRVGLDILLNTDLRSSLNAIECPLYWRFGAKDSLVPAGLVQVLQDEFKQLNVVLDADASHAPFISQQNNFIRSLIDVAESLRHHKI